MILDENKQLKKIVTKIFSVNYIFIFYNIFYESLETKITKSKWNVSRIGKIL
jgi:hypothetical protein